MCMCVCLLDKTAECCVSVRVTSFCSVILGLDAMLNTRMNGCQEVCCLSHKFVGLAHRTGLIK